MSFDKENPAEVIDPNSLATALLQIYGSDEKQSEFAGIIPLNFVDYDEFGAFILNTISIFRSSDFFNGAIYPTPFSFAYNEHAARGTKNLLIIIINGVLIISSLLNVKVLAAVLSFLYLASITELTSNTSSGISL